MASRFLGIVFIAGAMLWTAGCACTGHSDGDKDAVCGNGAAGIVQPVKFPYSSPPGMLSQKDAAEYFAEHYWDKFLTLSGRCPSSDSTMICGVASKDVEEAMAGYVSVLKTFPLDKAGKCVTRFAESLTDNASETSDTIVMARLVEIFERYCFDPNSPVRDEDIYGFWAATMAKKTSIGEADRTRYASDAALCSLNRRGTKAADFSFSYKNGRTGHLYGIKAPLTLVFFSNPGCHACKEIIDVLSSNAALSAMVGDGRLAVVNIYIDEDMQGWYDYMSIYPEKWHNVFDHNYAIRGDELYNIRAIPSLYLLDADKTVLLKDAPPQEVYGALAGRVQ